jgi:hypothetical protein
MFSLAMIFNLIAAVLGLLVLKRIRVQHFEPGPAHRLPART